MSIGHSCAVPVFVSSYLWEEEKREEISYRWCSEPDKPGKSNCSLIHELAPRIAIKLDLVAMDMGTLEDQLTAS